MALLRFVTSLALVLSVAPAWAGRIAALPPQIDPPASPELRDRFQDALSRGLSQGGGLGDVEVLAASEVRTKVASAPSCTTASCYADLARDLRVDRLALAEVGVAGKNYTFTLRLLDQGGAEVWRTTERCDICSVREADTTLAKVASGMGPWINRPGPTDQARQAAKEAAKEAELRASAKAPPAVVPANPALPSQKTPQPSEPRKWTGYRYGWISALVVGGLLVGGSIPFLAYAPRDGEITCAAPIQSRNCETIYKGNLGTGLGLLIAGVAVGGAGFGILYPLDRREMGRTPRVTLAPLPGGGFLGLEGID